MAWCEPNGHGGWQWKEEGYQCGQDTGEAADAEVFAVAAALGHAITKVGSECSVVQKVRMFSDCRIVLEGLDTGSISCLGPALSSGWAVQAIYDRTDFLEERDVSIQLV